MPNCTAKINRLGRTLHHPWRDHPAADDPDPARIRARRHFSSWEIARQRKDPG